VYAFNHLGQFDPARGSLGGWLKVISSVVAATCSDGGDGAGFRFRRCWKAAGCADDKRRISLNSGWSTRRRSEPCGRPLQRLPSKSREALILRYYASCRSPGGTGARLFGQHGQSRVVYGLARLAELLDAELSWRWIRGEPMMHILHLELFNLAEGNLAAARGAGSSTTLAKLRRLPIAPLSAFAGELPVE